MPRYALKVAYDGTRFNGSQRQPGVRTVEGDLLEALQKSGLIESVESSRFLAASRTDAGVSAAGNVFALTTNAPAVAVHRALNDRLHDVWVLAVREVPEDFHPRRSHRRRYRYHQRRGGFDEHAFRETLRLFEGTHDFTCFARLKPTDDPVRTLEAITVRDAGAFLDVDLVAPNFLWNQVRRMIGAALAVARGEATQDDVRAMLARKASLDLGLAAPEPLVLLDVEYAFPLAPDPWECARLLTPRLEALTLEEARLRDVLGGARP